MAELASGSCADKYNPAHLGFHMPAEWHRHERCWMAWPCRAEVWGERIEATRRNYAAVAKAIRQFEPVTMLVPPAAMAEARKLLEPEIEVLEMPADDSWTPDSAPCFVISGAGELAGVVGHANEVGADRAHGVEGRRVGAAGRRAVAEDDGAGGRRVDICHLRHRCASGGAWASRTTGR